MKWMTLVAACLLVAAIAWPAEAQSSKTFQVGMPNASQFGGQWHGFGVELDPFWFWAGNPGDEPNWAMQTARLEEANIKLVRMMTHLEWFCLDPDLGVWDWTSTEANSQFRYLDWTKENNVNINLVEWGWTVQDGQYEHLYSDPTDMRFAQGVAMMLREFLNRGYTNIKWLTVGNEPDNEIAHIYGMDAYETMQRNIKAALIAEGINIPLMLPDSGGHWDYMQHAIGRLYDIADAYDFHRYAEWDETSNVGIPGPWETLWHKLDIQRTFAVDIDPDAMTKPMLITEAGKPGSTQLGPPEIEDFRYAIHMADYGVTALSTRTNGLIAWNAFDLKYFDSLAFTWGMWRSHEHSYSLRPWAQTMAMLATHAPPGSIQASVDGAPPDRPLVQLYRCGAVKKPNGRWSVFLVNRSSEIMRLEAAMPEAVGNLDVYRLDENSFSSYPHQMSLPKVDTILGGEMIGYDVASESMVVLVETDGIIPTATVAATFTPTSTRIPTVTHTPTATLTPSPTSTPGTCEEKLEAIRQIVEPGKGMSKKIWEQIMNIIRQ